MIHWLAILIQIFSITIELATDPLHTENYTANFEIKKLGANEGTVSFNVTGIYIRIKFCNVEFYNPTNNQYTTILPCDEEFSIIDGKCARFCKERITKTFDELPPTTKYFAVNDGLRKTIAVRKPQRVRVFGIYFQLLTGINVRMLMKGNQIEYITNACYPAECTIYYSNKMIHERSLSGPKCSSLYYFAVDFDILMLEFVMNCHLYPPVYYRIQNKYTIERNELFKPQFYLSYNVSDHTRLLLKFTNYFSSDICLFSVREPIQPITSDSIDDYESMYYAPCSNVTLTIPKPIYFPEVLIQTRFQNITKKETSDTSQYYEGIISKQLVVVENDEESEYLITKKAKNGFSLNTILYKHNDILDVTQCNVKYYKINRLVKEEIEAKCGESKQTCNYLCNSKLEITDLEQGTSYIFVIKFVTTSDSNNNFEEKIFIRTNGEPLTNAFTVSNITSQRNIKIDINELATMQNLNIRAVCYVSYRDENLFRIASCGIYPCINIINNGFTITDLDPDMLYDIKIIPQREYDSTDLSSVRTSLYEIMLSKEKIDGGYILSTSFSPEDVINPNSVCYYDVFIVLNNKIKLFYTCNSTTTFGPYDESIYKPYTIDSIESIIYLKKLTFNKRKKCRTLPLCSRILIFEGYDPLYDYTVSVTDGYKSKPKTIDLPKDENVIPIANTADKTVSIIVEKQLNKLLVRGILPPTHASDSKCKWELRILSSDGYKILDQKCFGLEGSSCPHLPFCSNIEINNIESYNYELIVYYARNVHINGVIVFRNRLRTSETNILIEDNAFEIPVKITISAEKQNVSPSTSLQDESKSVKDESVKSSSLEGKNAEDSNLGNESQLDTDTKQKIIVSVILIFGFIVMVTFLVIRSKKAREKNI